MFRSRPSFLPLEQGLVTEVAHSYEIVIIQMVIVSFWSDDLIQNDGPIPGPVVCYQGRAKSPPKALYRCSPETLVRRRLATVLQEKAPVC